MLRLLALSCAIALCTAEIYFQEDFSGDWESRWVYSEHAGKEWGKFESTAGKFYGDEEQDKGIKTTTDARFYGLSAKFDQFSNQGKDLVVQFTVKHEQNIDCGGGYVKVFGSDLDQKDMHGDSAYALMFGPDICGPGTKKVHVIFNYKGDNKLIKKDIRCKDDVLTHIYTLIVRPDNSYEVLIDNKSEQKGTLEEHWDFLKPKMIKDPEAKKPEDWDDREKIPDPEDTKPEDWDKAEHIEDPDATKPEDWDDEMDGEWEPPMIDNPEYKGEWKARQIDNPAYKGKWIHPEIENPEYEADDNLYSYSDIGAIGFDLWQVKSGTIFDNVLITDSSDEASAQAEDIVKRMDEEKKKKDELDEEDRKRREEEAKERGDEDMPEDDFQEYEEMEDYDDEVDEGDDMEEEDVDHDEL